MKKLWIALFAVAALLVHAGYDFAIDGKFRDVKKGIPGKWQISDPAAAKIVRGEAFFSRSLQLSAGKNAVQAVSRQSFPVIANDFVKVEAEVKGKGNAFLALEILNNKGEVVASPRIAVRPAGNRFADIKGKVRISDYAKYAPSGVRIVIGAEPGAEVAFYGVEAESDDD